MDGAPGAVAALVGGAVGEAVDGAEVCDDALVCAGQVFEFLHFVEEAAAGLRQLLHALVREVVGLGLYVLGAERLVELRVRPDRVDDAVELLHAAAYVLVPVGRADARHVRQRRVEPVAHHDEGAAARGVGRAFEEVERRGQRVVQARVAPGRRHPVERSVQARAVARQGRDDRGRAREGDDADAILLARDGDEAARGRADGVGHARGRAGEVEQQKEVEGGLGRLEVLDRLLDAVFVDAEVGGGEPLEPAPARALDDREVERDEVGLDAHDLFLVNLLRRLGGRGAGPDGSDGAFVLRLPHARRLGTRAARPGAARTAVGHARRLETPRAGREPFEADAPATREEVDGGAARARLKLPAQHARVRRVGLDAAADVDCAVERLRGDARPGRHWKRHAQVARERLRDERGRQPRHQNLAVSRVEFEPRRRRHAQAQVHARSLRRGRARDRYLQRTPPALDVDREP